MTNVEAIQIMIDFYEGKISYNDLIGYKCKCSLCHHFIDLFDVKNRCHKCPWIKHNKIGCQQYLMENLYYKDNYSYKILKRRIRENNLTEREKEFIQVRINMLKRWLEKEKELVE